MSAALPAARWLGELLEAIPVSRRGEDPEGVHRVRVALMRLRVWLRLGGWRVLRDDARWLRCAAGPVRDLDVRLSHHPPPAVEARCRRAWPEAHREWLAAVDTPRARALLTALALLPPAPRARAKRVAAALERRVLEAARGAFTGGLAPLHRLRCAVRRLRFADEWLGADTTALAALQDALGRACDAWLALSHAARGKAAAARDYRGRLERQRHEATGEAARLLKAVRPRLKGAD